LPSAVPSATATPEPTPSPTPGVVEFPSGLTLTYEEREQLRSDFGVDVTSAANYYGVFNGCLVVYVGGGGHAMTNIDLAGYMFCFFSTNTLHVYTGSSVLLIEDAYEAGWFIDGDIAAIWEIWYGSKLNGWPLAPEFVEYYKLIDDFERQYRHLHRAYLSFDEYGTYGGCDVVGFNWLTMYDEERLVDIAGYTFRFDRWKMVYAYKGSQFLELEDAYEAGWINWADIRDILEKYPGHFAPRNMPITAKK
jgi:hypothetical protein